MKFEAVRDAVRGVPFISEESARFLYDLIVGERPATDGISHRRLSEEERWTPQIREVFELLVKQHPDYTELTLFPDWGWARARKRPGPRKTYTVEYGYRSGGPSVAAKVLRGLRRRLWQT